jgi:hypothetical protein
MSADLKIDDKAFVKSLKAFAAGSRKSNQDVIKNQARLFVNDVILITPPNQNYKQQRKLGERAITGDIKKIMRGARSGTKSAITDPAKLHKKYRGRDGRVHTTLPFGQKFRVVDLQAYINSVIARVGILASGWNAAAKKLGCKVPDWAARHGTGGGRISMSFTLAQCKITITNAIRFAGGVKDLTRRVQAALDKRAGAMDRQLKNQQERAAKAAGFRR